MSRQVGRGQTAVVVQPQGKMTSGSAAQRRFVFRLDVKDSTPRELSVHSASHKPPEFKQPPTVHRGRPLAVATSLDRSNSNATSFAKGKASAGRGLYGSNVAHKPQGWTGPPRHVGGISQWRSVRRASTVLPVHLGPENPRRLLPASHKRSSSAKTGQFVSAALTNLATSRFRLVQRLHRPSPQILGEVSTTRSRRRCPPRGTDSFPSLCRNMSVVYAEIIVFERWQFAPTLLRPSSNWNRSCIRAWTYRAPQSSHPDPSDKQCHPGSR
jgi:hypothetical protein